ncbi:MAG: hypothetical protein Q4D21_07500 [Phascolarctobacterium sp.]|nr:hypothetical protein [Phascolarctobacterium sp.]
MKIWLMQWVSPRPQQKNGSPYGTIYPIEVKKSASPGKLAIKNFSVLKAVQDASPFAGLENLKIKIGTGCVICMANDLLPVDADNWYVPVWLV